MNNKNSLLLCHAAMTSLDYDKKWYAEHKDWKKKYNAQYYAEHKDYWREYYKKHHGWDGTNGRLDASKVGLGTMAFAAQPGMRESEAEYARKNIEFHNANSDNLSDIGNDRYTAKLYREVTDNALAAKVERDVWNMWKVLNEANEAKNAANARRSEVVGRQTRTVSGTPKKTLASTIKSWGDSFGSSWKIGQKSMIDKGKSIVSGIRSKFGL